VHAEVLPWTLMSTDFGADSSSRFPFRARTNRQTDATEHHTQAGSYTAGVGNNVITYYSDTEIDGRDFVLFACSYMSLVEVEAVRFNIHTRVEIYTCEVATARKLVLCACDLGKFPGRLRHGGRTEGVSGCVGACSDDRGGGVDLRGFSQSDAGLREDMSGGAE